MNKQGKLFLIPTPIGNDPDFPIIFFNQEILLNLEVFIVEELSTARRFLKKAGYLKDLNTVEFLVFNEQSGPEASQEFLPIIQSGSSVGLMSEAGLPCVADPGAAVVKLAHENNIEVVPLPGPSSIFLALMASGGNGQKFYFHGYLPIEKHLKIRKIADLEKDARYLGVSQIFMETPYRNVQLLELLIQSCKNDMKLCVACDLLSQNQLITTKSIHDWKKSSLVDIHKKPVIFVLFY